MKLTPYQSATIGSKAQVGMLLLGLIAQHSVRLQNTLAPLLKMDPNSTAFKALVDDLAGYSHLIDAIEIELFWNGNPGSKRIQ